MSENSSTRPWTRLYRALWRRVITLGIQPMMSGEHTLLQASKAAPSRIVYVQATLSIADTLIVEKAVDVLRKTEHTEGPNSPLQPLTAAKWHSDQSCTVLAERVAGRVTMRKTPALFTHLMHAPRSIQEQVTVVPVCVFWGRALPARHSFLRALMSDERSATAGLKRLFGLIFHRGDVHVCFGKPIALVELANHERGAEFATRRPARLMRLRFKTMQFVTVGPDHSHRRTLLDQVTSAPRVRKAIDTIDAAADTR